MKTNTACLNLIDTDLDNADGNTTLHVIACAPTLGWRDVSLSSVVYKKAPVDGIQDFILHGQPPSGPAADAIETFQLSAPITPTDWLQGVRISNSCGKPLRTIRTPVREHNPVGDNFVAIQAAGLKGDKLIIDVRYGGGCVPQHTFQLNWDGSFLKSNPAQVVLELSHNANGDTCRALLHEQLQFDLSVIIENPSQYILHVTSGVTEIVAHSPVPFFAK